MSEYPTGNPYGQPPTGDPYGGTPGGYGGQQPGAYGQPPYQQGPYQQGPYQQGPYQHAPYQQGPNHAPGRYPPRQPDSGTHGNAIVLLVISIVAIVGGGFAGLVIFIPLVIVTPLLAIPSVVLAVMAMNRAYTDPASARKLIKWGWISLVIDAGLSILIAVGFYVVLFVFLSTAPTH